MSILNNLNRPQREAVTHTEGPLLIIAGPGSGKTHTVACSIAYAIEENGVIPDKILAFSFTRKAREELRHRVQVVMERDENATDVWISTFHSFCGKVLHQDAQQLDISNRQEFTINELTRLYNEGTRAQVEYLQHHQFAEPEDVLRFINECTAEDVSPTEVGSYAQHRHISQTYVEIYQRYRQLVENGETNYTECQLLTNALLRDVPAVRERWQEKFDLIFVDEYQDTDPIQYQIIKTLAERHQNLRVVGDDDQGIYGFRGADIQNILNFEEDFCNAEVISLGQNYRSTPQIVEASRALAEFNPDRREKELFTRNPQGEKIKHLHTENHEREAATIADFIQRARQAERRPRDFAVLYRTNRQAEAFTEAFRELEIPYHVVGNSSNRDIDGVSLMTIHKAKGLEFPNVFVAGVCTSLLPFHNSNEQDWGEELRLLYVAMTRAKNWLCLSSYQEDAQYPRGKSQFLDYIPATLVESVETLENIPIPPRPEEMMPIVTEEPSDYVEPLPEQLLGDGMTVIGVDPGNIGTRNTNVGWSVTQKTSDGYSVLDFDTERPTGTPEDKLRQIEEKIKALIQFPSIRPHAIAVEKLEVTSEEERKNWFLYVAACVATVRSIADKEGIECLLYTPQHVKHAATGSKKASKEDVQKAVKQMCKLSQIPEPHHSADAIATSLCYLRSYLNSSRFEGNKRKEEIYNSGIEHLDNQKCSEAIAKFNEAINIDPVDAEIHCGLGRAYLGQGNLEVGENKAKEAIRLEENNYPDAQNLLKAIERYHSGCNFLDNREWNMAIDKFQEAINIEPIFTDAHCGLGRVHLAQGNLDEAENAAEKALGLTQNNHPDSQKLLDAIKYYHSGYNFLSNHEWYRAINKFQQSVNREPIFTDAHYGLGRVHLAQGNLDEAENAARKALGLINNNHPDSQKLLDALGHYCSGRNFLSNRGWNMAIDKFQEAINIEPIFTDAHCGLGRVHLAQGNLDEAESAAKEALKLKNNYSPAQELLGDVKKKYCDKGSSSLTMRQYDQAIAEFQRAVEIDPKFKDAHLGLGKTYLKLGDIETAEKEAKEALEVDDTCERANKLLEKIKEKYKEQGDEHQNRKAYTEAVKSYQQAIRIDKKYKDAYNNLGMVYRKMEEYSNAISAYQQAINIDESCHVAHTDLSIVYYEMGEYAKAVSPLKRAIEIKSDYQKAYYNLARTYFKMENLPDASETVLEATRLDVNDQDTLNLLKKIQDVYLEQGHDYLRISNLDAAELSAKKALKLNSSYQPAIDFLENIKQEYCKRGLTYLKKSEWKSAKKSVKKVLNIDQNYQPAYGLLKQVYYEEGVIHIKNSRYEKGINILQKANKINPNCEKTHYYLGLAYFQLGRLKEAQLSIKNALSIQPNYPRACKLLSEINDARNWLKLGGAKVRQFARWIVNRIGSKET
ncbi:MAG: crossover junction endodeoxyribonuclease RuvC [Candidatus Poribacteria bacterium]|nr:crossover junction endodeoxyribonuclease RuvC [Candidatus Poribacteria bacterium]